MTRDELIETMARAMDAAAGTHSAPPFAATWGEHAADVLAAIEAAGLAIVPIEATDEMKGAGVNMALGTSVSAESPWQDYVAALSRAMIEAGRI